MCGIAGIVYLKQNEFKKELNHHTILQLLKHRGPDYQDFKEYTNAVFYHSRLQIVDTSTASNQPFLSEDEKNALVFNGEIFNYQNLKSEIGKLKTSGDVEVLFKLLQTEGLNCLNALNGFFAFAFYNQNNNSLLIGRDRLGVKPLYYFIDETKFAFASELKPLMALIGKQELNTNQLYTYLRLNYCAGKETFFKNVFRLLPGECIELNENKFELKTWYKAPIQKNDLTINELLNDAIKMRLNADVPVGTFLSGGLDSSIISALAKQHQPNLNTFSIGFEHEHYFDETRYSEIVAKHINSNHHVYKLTEDDFLGEIDNFLNAIDEPFADSSAFNFYLLSKHTQRHVKVALSGDGADELFKGYNKHKALLLSKKTSNKLLAKTISSFSLSRKNSRDGFVKNKLRQVEKFNRLASLNDLEKQKFLASISSAEECHKIIRSNFSHNYFDGLFKVTEPFLNFKLEDTFDLQTVLSDDMLVKADRFSMQHGIEIRNPFLDYRIVNFALNLDNHSKINKSGQKLILKNSFQHLLPSEIFKRGKKGFELPLQKWLSNHFKTKLETDWLNKEKIEQQGLLNFSEVEKIKQHLFSENAGDSAAKLWAIIVLEAWLNNFKEYIKHA